MLSVAVLAAGRGKRLFGPDGGCKPLVEVVPGFRLIEYSLRESMACNPGNYVVVTHPLDQALRRLLERRGLPNLTLCTASTPTTGSAVNVLLRAVPRGLVVLTTSDVIGPPRLLSSFVNHAVTILSERPAGRPACIIAVSPADPAESTAIFAHFDLTTRIVTDYGKAIEPSDYCFASVRVMNQAFVDAIIDCYEAELTDTQVMSRVLADHPGSIEALPTPELFDVDDVRSLMKAHMLTRAAAAVCLRQ
jgi:CTP:molybdopterin cytidylyltransferase MocA